MSTMERDILISRVVDGLASDGDWRMLESLSGSDPSVWRELAVAQRQQVLLCGALDRAVDVAERVELPELRPAVIRFPGAGWKWSGWAAAAMVALAWMAGHREAGVPRSDIEPAALVPSLNTGAPAAEDFLQSYLDRGARDGTVMGEMDTKPVIELRPVKVEGGTAYDVVYARVILERTRLPDVYRLTTDEFGSQVPVKARLPKGALTRPPM